MAQARSLVLLAVAGVIACRDLPESHQDLDARQSTFARHFAPGQVITPEQSLDTPIVRVSGLAVRSDGLIALSDVSEGTVKLFSSTGTLRRIIGRKGDGPGEFRAPRLLRWTEDGTLSVVDVQLRRLQVFAEDGSLLRMLDLAHLGRINGFALLPSGNFAFTGIRADTEDVLVVTDSAARVRLSGLPIRSLTPGPEGPESLWASLRAFLLATKGDTAFVVSTLSDTLWTVNLRDGSVNRIPLRIPGYRAPFVPKGGVGPGPQGIESWIRQFHMPAAISVTPNTVTISIVAGVLNYGDPQILAHRDSRGSWWAINDAPPIISTSTLDVIALATPLADSVSLGFYRPRS